MNKCTKEVYASDLCLQSRYRGDGDGQFTRLRMRGVRESNLISTQIRIITNVFHFLLKLLAGSAFSGGRPNVLAPASKVLCDLIFGRLARQIVGDTTDDHLCSIEDCSDCFITTDDHMIKIPLGTLGETVISLW